MMLNEYEQQQLETIEEVLLRDPALAAHFHPGYPATPSRKCPGPRLLIVPGILIAATALFLGLGGAFAQGLGLVVLGVAWWTVISPVRRRGLRDFLTSYVRMCGRPWFP